MCLKSQSRIIMVDFIEPNTSSSHSRLKSDRDEWPSVSQKQCIKQTNWIIIVECADILAGYIYRIPFFMGFNAWILFQHGIQFRKYLNTNKKRTTNSWRLLLNNWNELPLYIIIVWHNATKEQQKKNKHRKWKIMFTLASAARECVNLEINAYNKSFYWK